LFIRREGPERGDANFVRVIRAGASAFVKKGFGGSRPVMKFRAKYLS
jgi:hypothetical protein